MGASLEKDLAGVRGVGMLLRRPARRDDYKKDAFSVCVCGSVVGLEGVVMRALTRGLMGGDDMLRRMDRNW